MDFETTAYTVWHVASVLIYSNSVGFCCSTEDGAVKPSLGGSKESLQQACRVSGQDKAATGSWTHKLWNMNYQRYNRASFLLQAKVLESRLAWVLYDAAHAKAIETADKLKAAKKNLADRKRQLDESQAPIKFVLACVSLKPSLMLSCEITTWLYL